MPKVSVYLPDELYDKVRKYDIQLSAVTQRALQDEVSRRNNAEWVERMRSRPPRVHKRLDTLAVLDEVRDEFGA